MDDDAVHGREAGRHVLRIGVGLQDVLALDVDALEAAIDGSVEHVGNAQARLIRDGDAPGRLEDVAHVGVLDVAVARQLVRERAHVARALHVVLAAERIHADAGAADVDALEAAIDGSVEHVGNAQARLIRDGDAPGRFEDVAHVGVLDVAVARQLVRERAHVARALHVVLAAERIHADAGAADVAREHGEVGDADDGRRALAVLGDAQAVVDRGIAAGGVEPGSHAELVRGDAGQLFDGLGAHRRVRHELGVVAELVPVAPLADKSLVVELLRDDDVRQGRHHGDVGARAELEMMCGLDVGRADEIDAARINDDQLGAGAEPLLEA